MTRTPASFRSRVRPAYALALATALLLSACAGDGDSAEAVSGGTETKLGPVTVTLPEGFHVIDVTGGSDDVGHFAASKSPTGDGDFPSVKVTWTHKAKEDAEHSGASSKALLTSGYGGNSDIQRDEAVTVPGASAAWRLGFTRSYKGVAYQVGWVIADYPGKGQVLVVANAHADEYDEAQFDAVLDSVKLS
jgi:hypothetical protein